MTTKRPVDVEKLHQIFNKESRYNDERNLLFVWTLIGIAQLDCFSFLKIKDRVWIPFERHEVVVLNLIELLSQECANNNIDFAINEKHQFVICNTAFEFYKVSYNLKKEFYTPNQYTFTSIDLNAAFYDRTKSEKELIEQGSIEAFLNVNINTNRYLCRR